MRTYPCLALFSMRYFMNVRNMGRREKYTLPLESKISLCYSFDQVFLSAFIEKHA